jgi:holo-[acyl-carrier protein] synthase
MKTRLKRKRGRKRGRKREISTMEIVGVGTDIVECLRIGRMIERHGEIFLTRVYTDREIRYCQERKRSTEHFAGRWAAKEAILKCLGTGWSKGISWTDMEIRNDLAGRPRVYMCGAAKDRAQKLHIADILISISHCRAYATAHALAVSAASVSPEPAACGKPPPA